ncbi:hypothetical protein QBC37DRAFT_423488 [Rhypophila decipiens]|uniref:Gamma-glutamylcyclotransferase AIG2-like domain-containing protein n=1 Tax=Rhypophila decipiens TaxID=261697 RepID=A0AAN6Y786_9PEZI|nr:hypothetical protein QBC37DRAFT_423488 [Rhypophila decipiens]
MAAASKHTEELVDLQAPMSSDDMDLSDGWEIVLVPEIEGEIPEFKPDAEDQTHGPEDDANTQIQERLKSKLAIHHANKQLSKSEQHAGPSSCTEAPGIPIWIDKAEQAIQASSEIDSAIPLNDLITGLGFSPAETPSTLPSGLVDALRNRLSEAYLTSTLKAAQSSPKPNETLPIFVFGAFVFPAVVWSVIRDLQLWKVACCMTPARIKGYKKCAVRHGTFPAAFPSAEPDAEIQGMVIFGMDSRTRRKRLERFQNAMYDLHRGMAEIVSAEGTVVKHEVVLYVWNGPSSKLVIPGEGQGDGGKWSASRMMRDPWARGIIERSGEKIPECCGWEEAHGTLEGKLEDLSQKMDNMEV